jgi:Flp pilus assembly protein TadD
MKRLLTLIVVTFTSLAQADVLVLKDGTRVEGDVKRGERGYVVTTAPGKFKVVPLEMVKSIELQNGTSTAPDVMKEKLASLRRSVEHDEDIHNIIARYRRFVQTSGDTTVAEEAKQDLAVWEQRRDAGLVKYGPRWVTEKERAELAEKALQVAGNARRMLKDGRLAEAETVINQALAENPKDPTALYLRGVLQFKQDQIIPARKTFEQVNTLTPNHAPTLNNLAVIAARQNQATAALNYYDHAMNAPPRNQAVLDNVAEMLYAVPDEQRGGQLVQKLARKFTEQDIELQRELEKQGMHRWGATWVTSEQLKDLKIAERAVQDKLDQLSADFDATKVRINNIDRDIEENDRAMRRLEANSYVRDFNGNIYQAVLPSTYYQLQDDNAKLHREREEQYGRLERLRREARRVNEDLPVPKYTGIMRLIDAEGAPTVIPQSHAPAPTTQATTTTQPVG